jgi:hypothetical protein
MGFMDKVKAQATVLADKAQTGVQQGQTKLQEMQDHKHQDALLRELGAYVFLSERGRTVPGSEEKVAALMAEIDTLEAGGTIVAPTPETVPPAGAVPQAGAVVADGAVPQAAPAAAAPIPTPTEAPPAPAAGVPTAGGGLPQAGGGLPQAGGGLPGQ